MNLPELLALDRPLIVFDTETTGPEPATDRIVELGFVMFSPGGDVKEWQTYVNPLVPIPKEASFGNGTDAYPGHGITDDKVRGCRHCGRQRIEHEQYGGIGLDPHCSAGFLPWPTFRDLAPNLLRGFHACDYGGFNVKRYDLPLLAAEFARTGHTTWSYADARILDGVRLWQLGQPRTLGDAVEQFLHRKHDGAHRALDDVRASVDVIVAQLQAFTKLPRDVARLHELQWPVDPNAVDPEGRLVWKDGEVVFNFGKKWKGTPLKLMTRRDLEWISNTATGVSPAVKSICRDALAGKFPTKETKE